MLHPHSTARNLWDALIASLLIYIAIFTPVALGFTYEQSADHQGFEAGGGAHAPVALRLDVAPVELAPLDREPRQRLAAPLVDPRQRRGGGRDDRPGCARVRAWHLLKRWV